MNLENFDDLKKTSFFFSLKPCNAIYYFIIILCFSIFSFLVWAFFSPMDEIVKGSVTLRPINAVSSIRCVTSGQLSFKNYHNDDVVNEGDLLFSLDSFMYKTELEAYQHELINTEKEIYVNEIFLETIEKEILPDSEKSAEAFIKAKSYISELRRYEKIVEDTNNKLIREIEQPAALKIPQKVVDIRNQLNQEELTLESWKANQKYNVLETKKTLDSLHNSLLSHITELERTIKNSTIVAPISGRIVEVKKLNIGDYLLTGEEILKIIPQNEEILKADIYIDPNQVARVKIGNTVNIKFPGLPPSRYGIIETRISLIPPDVSYINGNAVFIAESIISSPYLITKKGQSVKLIPGISAEARITTDRCTVMQMILKKLDFFD